MSRGAKVIISNRTRERAETLSATIPESEVVDMKDLVEGNISGDVLVNATILGMEPNIDSTPVPKSILPQVYCINF